MRTRPQLIRQCSMGASRHHHLRTQHHKDPPSPKIHSKRMVHRRQTTNSLPKRKQIPLLQRRRNDEACLHVQPPFLHRLPRQSHNRPPYANDQNRQYQRRPMGFTIPHRNQQLRRQIQRTPQLHVNPPPTSWTPTPILAGYTSYKVEYMKTSGTTSAATTEPQRAPKH
jgi:hypothetical protein